MLAKISKTVFIVIVVELCLGGGGRLTAIGSVSLRMTLFGLAIGLSIVRLAQGVKIATYYWKILAAFLVAVLLGCMVGWLNHNSIALIWEDIRPLLYFLVLPFFALTIDVKETKDIALIIKISSLALCCALVIVLCLIHSGLISFLSFYELTEKTQEFFYRGQLSFFYKGFLFLGIGCVFYYFSDYKRKYFLIVMLVAAITLSVTRGLLFALAVTLIIHHALQRKFLPLILFAVLGLFVVLFGNKLTTSLSRWLDASKQETTYEQANPDLFGVRNYSDEGRVAQLKQVKNEISPFSLIVGHGFGKGIPARPVHMEIAYLEILHKQGLIGLAFWGMIAALLFIAYQKSDQCALANAFFFAAIYVFVESSTNQYFNNPIGMSVLLLSLVSLNKLAKSE